MKQMQKAPYEIDGFERVDINEVTKYQISRLDLFKQEGHSETISFRRKK